MKVTHLRYRVEFSDMKTHKFLLFAGLLVTAAATAFGANTWTKDSWSSTWIFPDDVRTLKKAVNYGARWVTTNVPRRMSEELPPANPL